MKRNLLFFALILFVAIPSKGGITYYVQTRLFVGEIAQEISHGKIDMIRPFIVLPNRSLRSSKGQLDFLCSIFNFKEIILKEESKELAWEPSYRGKSLFFPRIIQTIKLEGNEYEITQIPDFDGVKMGLSIHISLVKSLPEEKKEALFPLKLVYDETSEGSILNTKIKEFGNLFYICFPIGKKVYILSFYHISAIGAPIHRR